MKTRSVFPSLAGGWVYAVWEAGRCIVFGWAETQLRAAHLANEV